MARHRIAEFKRAEAEANYRRIRDWFRSNPFSTQTECANALELSVMTVSRNYRRLRNETQQRKEKGIEVRHSANP